MFGNYYVQTFIKTKSEPENLETNKSSWFASKALPQWFMCSKTTFGEKPHKGAF